MQTKNSSQFTDSVCLAKQRLKSSIEEMGLVKWIGMIYINLNMTTQRLVHSYQPLITQVQFQSDWLKPSVYYSIQCTLTGFSTF